MFVFRSYFRFRKISCTCSRTSFFNLIYLMFLINNITLFSILKFMKFNFLFVHFVCDFVARLNFVFNLNLSFQKFWTRFLAIEIFTNAWYNFHWKLKLYVINVSNDDILIKTRVSIQHESNLVESNSISHVKLEFNVRLELSFNFTS